MPPVVAIVIRGSITRPRGEGARDQPLVVSNVAIGKAVGIGGIEKRDAGAEGGVEDVDRSIVVAIGIGRQAQAADCSRSYFLRRT